ncbi:HAD family hydrolase [Bernardetia sp. ABR2-2B]|uniref:HAD family hydrolase n=1 Tax=Bernardetia sp. ABR2-2B TaxID=3127472 RepID=UPI0030D1653F
MNISFDLDSTLIPHGNEFEAEKQGLLSKLLGIEPIRVGTAKFISDLQKQEHEIHIYTTSFRSQIKIRLMLFYYGIKVGKIINQSQNQHTLKSRNINASKYPPAFGFDLHIDDLKGVGMEGERLNFKTIIIKTNDKNWIETIQKEITFEQ